MSEQIYRSGFVSLIGRPNVGKSTLLNQLSGMHLAITSPKPQTTRALVRAIVTDDNSQIVFLDTPGMLRPKNRLGESMKASVHTAIREADVIAVLVDATAATAKQAYPGVPQKEEELLKLAFSRQVPVVLLLNKVDRVRKEALLPLIALYASAYSFAAILPVSARTGDGIDELLDQLRQLLPQGAPVFPADMVTDQTERSLTAELIREQILYHTEKEIPHGTAVTIESFEEPVDESGERLRAVIHAVITCERDTHTGILIGKGGSMLKQIGQDARQRIEQMLGCPCYLELFVKVREDWRNRPGMLRGLGFDDQN
ncbi:MAG: GTPase Era [Eubacteriales bacterium]|nr:GTPase Era [Eubacteriales bacterium]